MPFVRPRAEVSAKAEETLKYQSPIPKILPSHTIHSTYRDCRHPKTSSTLIPHATKVLSVVFAADAQHRKGAAMPATQKQIDANRRNSRKSTGPKSPEGKIRAALNGWRHGLTGQVLTMAEEDRDAFETFANQLRQAYFPIGALEIQIANSIAEDEWRLSRARAIENNIIALGHSTIDGDVETINTQMHAAMTQARVFWRNPEKFALLSLYEQRISRKLQHNETRLRLLQTDRKAALQQALEEAAILAELAESKKETYDPTPDLAHHARCQNGFGFSTEEIHRLLTRYRLLKRATNPQIHRLPARAA
jgi:hypothetical protein